MVKWHDVTENVKFALKDDGFDHVAPFRLDRYNALFAATDENSNSKITDAPEDCLCVVIGNTKRIWPIFEEYYKANIGTESMPKEEANPFDFYVKKKIDSICIADFVVAKYQTDSSLAIQKMAKLSGMAILHEGTHMSVNRKYGPWMSLRAVVLFHNVKGPDTPLPMHEVPSLTSEMERESGKAFEEAAEYYRKNSGEGLDKSKSAEFWIKVRDCLTSDAQKEFRFDERQMNYHYDIDRNLEYLLPPPSPKEAPAAS